MAWQAVWPLMTTEHSCWTCDPPLLQHKLQLLICALWRVPTANKMFSLVTPTYSFFQPDRNKSLIYKKRKQDNDYRRLYKLNPSMKPDNRMGSCSYKETHSIMHTKFSSLTCCDLKQNKPHFKLSIEQSGCATRPQVRHGPVPNMPTMWGTWNHGTTLRYLCKLLIQDMGCRWAHSYTSLFSPYGVYNIFHPELTPWWKLCRTNPTPPFSFTCKTKIHKKRQSYFYKKWSVLSSSDMLTQDFKKTWGTTTSYKSTFALCFQ